jgi:hypothetical protein
VASDHKAKKTTKPKIPSATLRPGEIGFSGSKKVRTALLLLF